MEITQLKNTNKDRLFNNIPALQRLLIKKGYFVYNLENYVSGILLTSERAGISIYWNNSPFGIKSKICKVKYIKKNKEFITVYN